VAPRIASASAATRTAACCCDTLVAAAADAILLCTSTLAKRLSKSRKKLPNEPQAVLVLLAVLSVLAVLVVRVLLVVLAVLVPHALLWARAVANVESRVDPTVHAVAEARRLDIARTLLWEYLVGSIVCY
jgi:hypothetical protein